MRILEPVYRPKFSRFAPFGFYVKLAAVKEQYIAAKERWAQKMAGKAKPTVRSHDRLPPGQRSVHNFPVLDLGVRPDVPLDKWTLKIGGKVEHPVTLNWQEFLALPQFKDVSDFHCVTTWSQFDMEFEGVAFFTIAELVKPKPEASHVFFKSTTGIRRIIRWMYAWMMMC